MHKNTQNLKVNFTSNKNEINNKIFTANKLAS